MSLIDAFVHNPVKVTVGVLLVVLYGFIAIFRMPMQLTPEVQIPTITVETNWPGASPQEVEREIILEQEEQLKSVEGITKMTSESADSRGMITLEFQIGSDMEEALLKVNSRLQQVPEYPEDADQPVITTANSSDSPIAWFILGPRRPSEEQLAQMASEKPALAEELDLIRQTKNQGLAMYRLRQLAEAHPECRPLLPPDGFDVTQLRRFAEDEIEARFERVAGVSQSNVLGGLEDELQVIVDPQKLAARRLTIGDVRAVLRGQNEDTSAGDFWEGKRRWVVRTLGQFRSPEQVENQLLTVQNDAPVYVRDVATVQLDYKKPDGLVRRFGESRIAVNAVRESGANVLDVMAGLKSALNDLNKGVLKYKGLELAQVYDETEYINSSIDLVRQNIFIGGALTMAVLMVFLHLGWATLVTIPLILAASLAAAYLSPWFFVLSIALIVGAGFGFARGALVVGLAIPTSIVGTFLILWLWGRSLNVISLAGMAFAVGMLVDNAVVVLENVYRHCQLGTSPWKAAVRGTHEVWGAVVASTLTTVAVFLPIVFVQEEAGQLFGDIAMAITAAVGLSLAVSVTVIPTASARLFQRTAPQSLSEQGSVHHSQVSNNGVTAIDTGEGGLVHSDVQRAERRGHQLVDWLSRTGEFFIAATVNANAWIQRSVVRRVATVAGLVGLAVSLSYVFWPQVEYLPSGNRNLVFGILLPPPGYNLDQLMRIGETVETALKPYWDIRSGEEDAPRDFPIIDDFFYVARGRQVFMGLRARDPLRAGELVPLIQQVSGKLPGTFAVAKQSSLFEQGLTAGRTIDIEITGPELTHLVALGGQVLGQVMQQLPRGQARPVPSLDLSSPELHVEPKLMQAAQMGMNSAELGYAADALIDGAYAGDYYLGGDKIDLRIVGRTQFADSTQEIAALSVSTPLGQLVPLEALASVKLSSGPEQINHRERERAITVEVSPPQDMPLEAAMNLIQREIVEPLRQGGQLEGGYRVTLAGTADKLRNTWESLRFNVFLALLITYLLMAALFESWLYPFVIILSVPVGAVGGILGLNILNLFYNQPLDVLTMLGFVMLIGTVVNNPILIVHQSLNHMREDGMEPNEAILKSLRSRIRPIFMTTTTTVLGLLPLVLFPGAGSELYRGLGSVVLGGLIVSTLVTLVLVPTLFSLSLEARRRLSSWRRSHVAGHSASPQQRQAETVSAAG